MRLCIVFIRSRKKTHKFNDLIDNHFYYLRSPKNDNDVPFLLYRHIKDRKLANTVGYGPEIERFIVDSYFDVKLV